MRTQISTSVSEQTRKQADELIEQCGYSLRDVITIAIDRFYKKEIQEMKGHSLQMPDNAGKGLTSWVAECSCGAKWRCEYSRHGLEWKPLNDKCKSCPHNR